jgi:hypothetical protein
MEVNFSMRAILFGEAKEDKARTTSFCLLEDKKILILEQLEEAVEKLKEARQEIREVVQMTWEMKDDGDDIADQVITAVAETTCQ